MKPFPKDFLDFLKLLAEQEVRYLVVGGYALSYHGYVRFTGDLDIFVEVSEENSKRLSEVFLGFGFSSGFDSSLFSEKGKMVRIGTPPMRLEILTEISGVEFEDAYEFAEVLDYEGIEITFIDFNNLIRNKRSAGRPKDISDVQELLESRKNRHKKTD